MYGFQLFVAVFLFRTNLNQVQNYLKIRTLANISGHSSPSVGYARAGEICLCPGIGFGA
jgi:hypothetical protein